jgi:hypothetical protein
MLDRLDGRRPMTTVVLIVALVSGLFTLLFILAGVRRLYMRAVRIGLRVLLITTVLSVLTGIFTIWQLVQVLQQFEFHW